MVGSGAGAGSSVDSDIDGVAGSERNRLAALGLYDDNGGARSPGKREELTDNKLLTGRRDEYARVGDLAAGLAVERRGGDDDVGAMRRGRRRPAGGNRRSGDGKVIVADKLRGWRLSTELRKQCRLGGGGFPGRLSGGARDGARGLSRGLQGSVEACDVDGDAGIRGEHGGEINGEAVCVVELKGVSARERVCVADGGGEACKAAVKGGAKEMLLGLEGANDGVCGGGDARHRVGERGDKRGGKGREARVVQVEGGVGVEEGAAEDAASDVAARRG